jgi:hypothetical protein
LIDADHIIDNVDGQVGFFASYYSEVDGTYSEYNSGISDEEGTPMAADESGASHISNKYVLSDEEGTPTTTDKNGASKGSNNNGIHSHS